MNKNRSLQSTSYNSTFGPMFWSEESDPQRGKTQRHDSAVNGDACVSWREIKTKSFHRYLSTLTERPRIAWLASVTVPDRETSTDDGRGTDKKRRKIQIRVLTKKKKTSAEVLMQCGQINKSNHSQINLPHLLSCFWLDSGFGFPNAGREMNSIKWKFL